MSEVQESWKAVSGKAESLGLKLKLHLEQEMEETEDREPGDTKAMIDDLGRKLSDVFDSVGNAAKDPAVHADVKEVGALFKDALVATFHKVGAEVGSRPSPDSAETPDGSGSEPATDESE